MRGNGNTGIKISKAEYPQYLSFGGNYVFSVPKTYSVDEQSIPGIQLVYTSTISAKNLEDVYNAGGISVQALTELSDHSAKAFKDYVNNTYLEQFKKNDSVKDTQLKFSKENGWDVAHITATKDGKSFRFIYVKNGQHPVVVVAKQETDTFKKIEQTIIDVENSDLKSEAESIKQSAKNIAQSAKDQKAPDLYALTTQELKDKTTQSEIAKALDTAKSYTSGNITISGGNYSPGEFTTAIRFVKLDKNDQQPAFGSMILKKVDGQWKLQALSLPSPKQ